MESAHKALEGILKITMTCEHKTHFIAGRVRAILRSRITLVLSTHIFKVHGNKIYKVVCFGWFRKTLTFTTMNFKSFWSSQLCSGGRGTCGTGSNTPGYASVNNFRWSNYTYSLCTKFCGFNFCGWMVPKKMFHQEKFLCTYMYVIGLSMIVIHQNYAYSQNSGIYRDH